jgi:hypothetical protein
VKLTLTVDPLGALKPNDWQLRRPFHGCKVCGKLFNEGDEVAAVRFENGDICVHLACAKAASE